LPFVKWILLELFLEINQTVIIKKELLMNIILNIKIVSY